MTDGVLHCSSLDRYVSELAPEVTKTAVGRLMQAAKDLENRGPGAVISREFDDVSGGERRTDERILETICDFRPAYSFHGSDYMTDYASSHMASIICDEAWLIRCRYCCAVPAFRLANSHQHATRT
jgi:hypothetical protein